MKSKASPLRSKSYKRFNNKETQAIPREDDFHHIRNYLNELELSLEMFKQNDQCYVLLNDLMYVCLIRKIHEISKSRNKMIDDEEEDGEETDRESDDDDEVIDNIEVEYWYEPYRYHQDRDEFLKETELLKKKFRRYQVYPRSMRNDLVYCIFINRYNKYFGYEQPEIPRSLKPFLKEDLENIKNKVNYKLPFHPKVHNLLEQFEKDEINSIHDPTSSEEDLFRSEEVKQFRLVMENYFNDHMEFLLCEHESYQFALKFPADKRVSNNGEYLKPAGCYGIHHLIRFLRIAHILIERDRIHPATWKMLSEYSQKLMKFLGDYFEDDSDEEIPVRRSRRPRPRIKIPEYTDRELDMKSEVNNDTGGYRRTVRAVRLEY